MPPLFTLYPFPPMNPPLPDSLPAPVLKLLDRAEDGDLHAYMEMVLYYLNEVTPQDWESAVHWAHRGAELREPNCLFFLGQCYLEGNGVEQDESAAGTCLTAASEMGHPHAALYLANLMLEGRVPAAFPFSQALKLLKTAYDKGVVEDIPELSDRVLTFLSENATKETPELCFQYGQACYNALFCPTDDAKAVHYYRMAADAGHAVAQYELGLCYLEGRGVPQDATEAERLNRMAAEQGLALAEYEEGCFLSMGDGVPQDEAAAFDWFAKAAEHDHPGAHAAVGVYYEEGRFVERDVDKALEHYRRSMELGSPKGYYHFGLCHVHGTGVKQSIFNGMDLLHHAARKGFGAAEQEMEKVMAGLTDAAQEGDAAAQAELAFLHLYQQAWPESQPEEAARLFSLSAQQEHPRGLFGLGLCYLRGHGMEENPERGLELICQAAMNGEVDALATYGELLCTTVDDEEMHKKGLEYLRLAAANGSEIAEDSLKELGE